MSDKVYCYPNSNVLINKLNITDPKLFAEAEEKFTFTRLQYLQENPIMGNFDFEHLKAIHKYIFQDLFDWAGKVRTVEIGKGNLFCTTACIQDYAESVFNKYFSQCYNSKDNPETFIKILADNYGDLNALHPFREGNGRTQREFARLVCLECGYDFDLSGTTHSEMLNASKLSFDKADSSLFVDIFTDSVRPISEPLIYSFDKLNILSSDDLSVSMDIISDYYEYTETENIDAYSEYYKDKIDKMNSEEHNTQDFNDFFEEYTLNNEKYINSDTEKITKENIQDIDEDYYNDFDIGF